MPRASGKLPAKPSVRHPCVNVMVSPRKRVISPWPLLNKSKQKLPREQMVGNAQMSRWRQREPMRSLYMTGLAFTWHFGDLQPWLPAVPLFHQCSVPHCQHMPCSCETLSTGGWRSGSSEYQETQAQLSEEDSKQAVLFRVLFRQQD